VTKQQGPCSQILPAVPPLVSVDKAGAPYTRHGDVEAEISAALALPPSQWLVQMPLRGGWTNETRIHLLRRIYAPEHRDVFGQVLDRLMKRIEPIIEKWARGFSETDLEEIKTHVGMTIVERILEKKSVRQNEIVEISLSHVVKNETLKEVARRDVRSNIGLPAPEKRTEAGSLRDPVAEIVETRPDPLRILMEKNRPKFREILKAVKDPRHRRAFTLFHLHGWPYDPKDPSAPSLCKYFNRSERRIRQWIEIARSDMEQYIGDPS
jgi:hypothetical protein